MDRKEITRKSLIKAAKEVAQKKGEAFLLRTEFLRRTGVREHHVIKHFGSWTTFFKEAGLESKKTEPRSDSQLLEAARDRFSHYTSLPTASEFFRDLPRKTYERRWGKWADFLEVFRVWIADKDPAFHLLPDIERQPKNFLKRPQRILVSEKEGKRTHSWEPTGGKQFGAPISFRGLGHTPINEQGVVLLFGMICEDLGFLVEHIGSAFPDCEAKRKVRNGRWERIRIEFEYASREFLSHGHDETECDLIVCWGHNWAECPLEVLELRGELERILLAEKSKR